MASEADNRRGIELMLLAMACYVTNDALIKLTATLHGAGQILLLRGLLASLLMAAVIAHHRMHREWRKTLRPIIALRALLEVATAATSVVALSRLSLATVTSMMMIAPVVVAAVSMAVGLESRRADRFMAAIAGFLGVLIVLRPSSATDWMGLSFGLACALSLAARELVNRAMPAEIPSLLIAAIVTFAVTIAGAVMALTEPATPITDQSLIWMSAAAIVTAIGNSAVVAASRRADLSVVAPFRFSNILWALALGFLVWDEVPDRYALGGILLVVAAGVYILHSTRRPMGRRT